MSMEDIAKVPEIISTFAPEGGKILIQWHGGEPTALGRKWLEEALRTLDDNKGSFEFTHGIQTNLMNYDSSWADLYREFFDSSVGVSWDYKIRHIRGKDNSNDAFEAKFWDKLDLLVADGLEPYLVVTSTKLFFERYKNPYEFFDLMERHHVYKAHIERLTKVGYARDNWERIGHNNAEYSRYMSRFYKAYRAYQMENPNRDTVHLSPFDGLSESVDRHLKGEGGGYGCLSGSCDTKYHTIDANGYKKGCTALNSEFDNKRATDDVQVIRFFDFKSVREIRQESCEGCDFRNICSSGCLATNKFDDSGECSGGKAIFKTIKDLKVRENSLHFS